MLFLGFSDELSELNARTMIDYVLRRLRSQMPDKKIIVQTDNGVEFGGTTRHFEKSPFCQAVQAHGGEHLFIPPKLCNANGDVESLHNLIETEFFDIAKFESREDFIRKAESYRLFFNLERPNSYKGGKTPWLIAQQDWADNDLASYAAIIETVDLDKMTVTGYSKRGPGLPNSPVTMSIQGSSEKKSDYISLAGDKEFELNLQGKCRLDSLMSMSQMATVAAIGFCIGYFSCILPYGVRNSFAPSSSSHIY